MNFKAQSKEELQQLNLIENKNFQFIIKDDYGMHKYINEAKVIL